jgi:voltage-gated potassium channel
MKEITESGDTEPQTDLDDPSGRLAAYLAKTQTALDLLALATLWIVLVPPWDFGPGHNAQTIALTVRICLSVIYAIDMTIRTLLARHRWHYVRTHFLSLVVVLIPPLRVLFSLRLLRTLFRRGHLERFLLAASVLVLNGAVIVYLLERHASGGNIHTLGESVWWSVVTVTTVGYGDYHPITTWGRVTACFIMGIGILTIAVLTAQVSSSFVEQAARRRAATATAQADTTEAILDQLSGRLDRIEQLLINRLPEPQ